MIGESVSSALYHVLRAYESAPYSNVVALRNKKLQYIGRSFFFQQELDLPDFAMHAEDVEGLLNWVDHFPFANITARTTRKDVVFATSNEGMSTRFSLEMPTDTSLYDGISEVVTKPKLVNNYWFELSMAEQKIILDTLLAGNRNSKMQRVDVSIDSSAVTFASGGMAGSGIATIDLSDRETALPANWSGVYAMDSLFVVQNAGLAKFSFTDNEKNVLSPMMIEYQETPVVVVSPIWH